MRLEWLGANWFLLLRSISFEIMRRRVKFELVGGIGNQLFIYAAGQWFARQFGWSVSYDARMLSIEKAHGGLITDLYITGPVATLKGRLTLGRLIASLERVVRKQLNYLNERAFGGIFGQGIFIGGHDFKPDSIVTNGYKYVSAYFQTYRYSLEILSSLKFEYRLKFESTWLIEKRAIARKTAVLAIHIRRGDYVSLRESFGLLSAEYYRNAIEALRNRGFHWDEVWIFSDDIEGARDLISTVVSHENVSYIEPPEGTNPIESLMLFSESSVAIIANSTFSWWASFLSTSTKAVVAPSSWFRSSPGPQELIPESWLLIPSDWLE